MNLSQILRPSSLDDFIGQKHILNENSALYKLINLKDIPHMFFYGKPGSGKTSLAKIIAKICDYSFYELNATSLKIEQLRAIFKKHNNSLYKPLIFIDEIHRLSKSQQEVLLPVMENNSVIIMGASTENPHFSLTSAVISRSFLYEFKSLSKDELQLLIKKAHTIIDFEITNDAISYLINSSGGDARALLNLLEYSYKINNRINIDILKQIRANSIGESSSSSQAHYDLISAMIKSIRGSHIDASLYYLARLICGSENIGYITRRLVIFASEDIGNANPSALTMATNTMIACEKIGYPEANIILGQCVVYLASCPKSNSSYRAIKNAIQYINDGNINDIPASIQNIGLNYKNPHDHNGFVKQKYTTKQLKFYYSKNIGYEKILNDWIGKIKNANRN